MIKSGSSDNEKFRLNLTGVPGEEMVRKCATNNKT